MKPTSIAVNTIKNILILSYGPVPTPQYQKIEGGGMRCWGLAEGLHANGHTVTVGVNSGFPVDVSEVSGIGIVNWQLDESFRELLNSFDVIIVSYSMGDLSMFVADNIAPNVTLVLDGYVPIYIEVSARNSADIVEEYRNYMADIARHNHVLRRGDYFICANTPQEHMYMGILGSLGVLNPRSYNEHRLLQVPFGISTPYVPAHGEVSPYEHLGVTKDTFVLLWFGALYPWFNFKPMVEAIAELSSQHKNFAFVLVGGKNPYNTHPDFVSQYTNMQTELEQRGLIGNSVHFVDWVDFSSRGAWFHYANAVISLNRAGEENVYSWRTRVMDYVWGGVPMLTNGGDPLSDLLLEAGAAFPISPSHDSIVDAVTKLMVNPTALAAAHKNLERVQKTFLWPIITANLAERIIDDPTPYDKERLFALNHGIIPALTIPSSANGDIMPSLASKLQRYYHKAQEKGVKRSLAFGIGIVRAKASYSLRPRHSAKARVILLSHPIDDTGAPLVLLELAKDFGQQLGKEQINIAAPRAEKHLLQRINRLGFTYHKIAEGVGDRVINLQLNIQPDDFVLMNTVALHHNYKYYVYRLLQRGGLKQAYWFIHEDKPEIRLQDKGEIVLIRQLVEAGKLHILVPSQQTADEYNDFLGIKSVQAINLRVDMAEKYNHIREPKDFASLRFYISGTPSDGRKGQLLFLAALELARSNLASKNQAARPFEVHFVSIGSDYISEQIKAIGSGYFADRFHHYPVIERDAALTIANGCNVTACTSLNETFALFVAEGMMMGHVIMRNRSSGWNEQIIDGKNGYILDDLDIKQIAERFETILSLTTTNEELAKMGETSHMIAQAFRTANYYNQIFHKR